LQELRAAGRKLEDYNAGVTVYVSTVSGQGEVEAARAKALAASQARSDLYVAEGRVSSLARSPSEARPLPVSAGVVGTPDQVLKELEPQFKDGIFTHFLLRTTGPKEPFASEVLPVLKTWGRQPVAGTAAK
jgi:alkanesulfonate monooxygenase SsuD/methylene tetrahydromethanopterin reductase-like flavin-dependent oxidoreductase (luciferase family)